MPAPKPIRVNSARHAVSSPKKEEVSVAKVLIVLVLVGAAAFAAWHYRSDLLALLPAGADAPAAPETADVAEAEEPAAARDLNAVPDDWVSVAPDAPAADAAAPDAAGSAEEAAASSKSPLAREEAALLAEYNAASKAFNAALEGYNAVRADLTKADTRRSAEALAEKAVEGYRPLVGRLSSVPVAKNLADAESLLKELRALNRYMEISPDLAGSSAAQAARPQHAGPVRTTRAPIATRTAAPTASAAATKTAEATRSADQTMVRAPDLD